MMTLVRSVNDMQLEELLLCDQWLLVCFLSRKSVPCDLACPELDAVSERRPIGVGMVQIDVEENPSITRELDIQAVPTMVLYRLGDEWAHWEGPYSHEALLERIVEAMESKARKPRLNR